MPYLMIATIYAGNPMPAGQVKRAAVTFADAIDHLEMAYGTTRRETGDLDPEQGGIVGPLADRTIIEVQKTSGYALLQQIPDATARPKGDPGRENDAEYVEQIIDAFNRAMDPDAPPVRPMSPEAQRAATLAAMTDEQRAEYDASVARHRAEHGGS